VNQRAQDLEAIEFDAVAGGGAGAAVAAPAAGVKTSKPFTTLGAIGFRR
jgi:hypothetical protein